MDLKGLATQGSYSLSVERVFVDVGLSPESLHRIRGDVVDGNGLTDAGDGNRFSVWKFFESSLATHRASRRSRDRAVAASHPLAILGAPGGGKTTLLKHMTLTLCARGSGGDASRISKSRLPILLLLRQHADAIAENPTISLPALVRSSMGDIGTKEPPDWLEKRLAKRRCVVMLDGLDEVGSTATRSAVVDWVERQIATYSGNWFVITSRPYGYRSSPLTGATVVQVRAFTESQIATFVQNWYQFTEVRRAGRSDAGVQREAADGAASLIGKLRESRSLAELAVNPLLLTMMANVHKYRGALPGTRAELYREICLVFLARRQEAKRLPLALNADQFELVLRHLAFNMMCDHVRDVDQARAIAIIKPVLSDVSETLTPAEFLDLMETSAGLLQQGESGRYQFAHLTFQEYLASTYIAEKNLITVLLRNVEDGWWREATLLYVAQYGANEIVEQCLGTTNPTITALTLAADCADDARELRLELRRRLERMLSIEASSDDPARRRAIATVDLSRKYRTAIRVEENAWICPSPVSRREMRIFGESEFAPPRRSITLPLSPASSLDAATGLQRKDVESFLLWANEIIPGVRLPTAAQVDIGVSLNAVETEGKAIWVRSGASGLFLDVQGLPRIADFYATVRRQHESDAGRFRYLLSHISQLDLRESGASGERPAGLSPLTDALHFFASARPFSIPVVSDHNANALDLADLAARARRADGLLSSYRLPVTGPQSTATETVASRFVRSALSYLSGDDDRATFVRSCGLYVFLSVLRRFRAIEQFDEDILTVARLASYYLAVRVTEILQARPDYGGHISAPPDERETSPWDTPVARLSETILDYCRVYEDLVLLGQRLKGALPPTEAVLLVRP
ncbi:NACHT domain-containing protein [Dactylosporangium sp. NPDC049525]|uniref:NACHT domain-containing protein n=1 Tax=Dactylosporangium sp. NPDC049525 TaxID=3154730 RepID=UPI00344AF80F